MAARRLVMFVEGKGDVDAVPALVARLLKQCNAEDVLFADSNPFRVNGVSTIAKDEWAKWRGHLAQAARTRRDLGAVLVVLDGDLPRVDPAWLEPGAVSQSPKHFCAVQLAAAIAAAGRRERAGELFSLAVVFAMPEFEAWLLAGLEGLCGAELSDRRGIVPSNIKLDDGDVEARRDAKRRLGKYIPGYAPKLDQGVLAKKLEIGLAEQRSRSFRRLQSAVRNLTEAARRGSHVVSPVQVRGQP